MSFTFKQFHIDDTHCAMKVGTDGVLLGAWAHVKEAKHILDIGCGSGLVTLMAAQRNAMAQVTGIEIDTAAANDAEMNAQASPFKERVEILQADVLQIAEHCHYKHYDCILSNPPYHEEDLLPPTTTRAQARHTAGGGLTFAALLRAVSLLIDTEAPNASFSVILPTPSVSKFTTLATLHNLHLTRRTDVVTRKGKPCKRVLLEFKTQSTTCIHNEIELLGNGTERSTDYQALCADFYL